MAVVGAFIPATIGLIARLGYENRNNIGVIEER
jgi:hypothetical protein